MTRPQQHVAIWAVGLLLMVGLSLVLPADALFLLIGMAWGLALVSFVARGRYGRARALLAQKKYEAAFDELRAFEQQVTREAWRRHLAFLYAGFRTSDAIALARGYQGVVRLEQGRLSEAEALFKSALQKDPDYGVPWANRAIVAASLGDEKSARAHVATARSLGLKDPALDLAVAQALQSSRGRDATPRGTP
jgi:tetratricopeptide (TPR) repeat protein